MSIEAEPASKLRKLASVRSALAEAALVLGIPIVVASVTTIAFTPHPLMTATLVIAMAVLVPLWLLVRLLEMRLARLELQRRQGR